MVLAFFRNYLQYLWQKMGPNLIGAPFLVGTRGPGGPVRFYRFTLHPPTRRPHSTALIGTTEYERPEGVSVVMTHSYDHMVAPEAKTPEPSWHAVRVVTCHDNP